VHDCSILNDKKQMQGWLARLLDVPKSVVAGDDLEGYRWDVAHYFWTLNMDWTSVGVVLGNLTPRAYNMTDEFDNYWIEARERLKKWQAEKIPKEAFVEALKHLYDELNPD